jgi:hypothetical protein
MFRRSLSSTIYFRYHREGCAYRYISSRSVSEVKNLHLTVIHAEDTNVLGSIVHEIQGCWDCRFHAHRKYRVQSSIGVDLENLYDRVARAHRDTRFLRLVVSR